MEGRAGNTVCLLVMCQCIGLFVHYMVCWHICWFTYIGFVGYVSLNMHLYCTKTETISYASHVLVHMYVMHIQQFQSRFKCIMTIYYYIIINGMEVNQYANKP